MDLADPNPVSSLEALPSHPREMDALPQVVPPVWMANGWSSCTLATTFPKMVPPRCMQWHGLECLLGQPGLCAPSSLDLARCATRVLFANLGMTEALLSPMFPILSDLNPLQWRMPYHWVPWSILTSPLGPLHNSFPQAFPSRLH